jgi:hypothetical protein
MLKAIAGLIAVLSLESDHLRAAHEVDGVEVHLWV